MKETNDSNEPDGIQSGKDISLSSLLWTMYEERGILAWKAAAIKVEELENRVFAAESLNIRPK